MRNLIGFPLRKVKSALRSIDGVFFDRDWYVKQYPDVRNCGIDPFDHYRLLGRREGRIPGPRFPGGRNLMPPSARVGADWDFLEKSRDAPLRSRSSPI